MTLSYSAEGFEEVTFAYLAGIIDGEGSFTFHSADTSLEQEGKKCASIHLLIARSALYKIQKTHLCPVHFRHIPR
jgi:hypothetical protein